MRIAGYPRSTLVATRVASLLVVGLLVPIAEELYFRGHLLPRVEWMGLWAVPWTTVLFTLYHFHTPWQSPSRILLLLPLVYLVQRTRSVRVGIAVHCIGNTAVRRRSSGARFRNPAPSHPAPSHLRTLAPSHLRTLAPIIPA